MILSKQKTYTISFLIQMQIRSFSCEEEITLIRIITLNEGLLNLHGIVFVRSVCEYVYLLKQMPIIEYVFYVINQSVQFK